MTRESVARPTNNPASGIKGRPEREPENEADHYYVCPTCGQAVDMRDLGEVLHHEEPGHKPLPDQS